MLFLLSFCFYRAFFSQLTARSQIFAAPLWPMLKFSFKSGSAKLTELGKKPDAAPFVLFIFDAVAALSGNFLFMSALSIESVIVMITLDLIENFIIAGRITILLNQFLKFRREKKVNKYTVRKQELLLNKIKAVEESLSRKICKIEGAEYVKQSVLDDRFTEEENEIESQALVLRDGHIHMHRSIRLLLGLAASETGECVTSVWSALMLYAFYHSSNKQFFYTIKDFDENRFKQAMFYSFLDAVVEGVAFVALVLFIKAQTNVNVGAITVNYIAKKNIFWVILMVGSTCCSGAFGFFIQHYGVAPDLNFDEFLAPQINGTQN